LPIDLDWHFAGILDTVDADDPLKHQAKDQERTQLRSHLQAKRQSLDMSDVVAKSEAIASYLQALISPCTRVAGYLALGKEVQLEAAMAWARAHQCTTYVPVVKAKSQMVFAPYHEKTELIKNRFGINEPNVTVEDCLTATALDTILVPLVGFDTNCQRMGMGGGYYDRALAHRRNHDAGSVKPRLIGIAFDLQKTPTVFPEWWDVPLDIIVTESGIIQPIRHL